MNSKHYTEEDGEIEKSAHTLFSAKIGVPFKAPDGYFDALPYKIQERCVRLQKQSWLTQWSRYLLRPAKIGIFSMLVLTALTLVKYYNVNDTAPLTTDEIVNSLAFQDIDENALEDAVAANTNIPTDINAVPEDNSNKDIEQYLIDNDE